MRVKKIGYVNEGKKLYVNEEKKLWAMMGDLMAF